MSDVNERVFLTEYSWVVLSSGMREAVVRKHFPQVSAAFGHWQSAALIARSGDACVEAAALAFNAPRKLVSIVDTAERIAEAGFDAFWDWAKQDPVERLQGLRHIGPATVFHLAKNLGLPVAKPDRHLVRIATASGYGDPQALCQFVAHETGDTVPVVDIVLWRFATLCPGYLDFFLWDAE